MLNANKNDKSNARSSYRRCSGRKGVFRNFAKFTGKHLRQSLIFNKVAGLTCNFIKKGTLAQVFSCEFCKISKNAFFTEYLWVTASVLQTSVERYLEPYKIYTIECLAKIANSLKALLSQNASS